LPLPQLTAPEPRPTAQDRTGAADRHDMPIPVVLAVASAACFLALAHASVRTPHEVFRRCTSAMALASLPLLLVSPAACLALLAPVLFSRRLANVPVPTTVDELLERSRP
jgi:hypothetical protein